ncbi:MAG: TRAP transporter small permease subunit [Dehalococcoidales bacterium]|nr:TRAP transporter small permease subunit [Dehalococcoidales bacterium]
MKAAEVFCHFIDTVNEWIGKTIAWLFLPFTLLIMTDVITRYVFNKPWYYIDINVQIMGTLILFGGGYCYLHKGHIGVDTLVSVFSKKTRKIIDLALYPVLMGSLGALLWKTWEAAWAAWLRLERTNSAFAPPLYPYKTIIVLGIILVMLQGTAKFVRDLMVLIHPEVENK